MKYVRRFRTALPVALLCLCVLICTQALLAATVLTSAHPHQRITQKIDNSKRVTLNGHVPSVVKHASPSATGGAIDLGRVDPSTPMQHMRLVLRSSPAQTKELRRIIDEQQDGRTANYHQWLTPEEFGTSFGVHDADIRKVSQWLKQQGFSVENITKGKRVIQFSGTSGQVESAFQTEIHSYAVKR